MSGETVGFLDPHETYFTDDDGKRGVSGKRYYFDEDLPSHVSRDQFLPFHGIFGCNFDTTNSYDGTLFRFPLRITPSELSKKKYTEEMIDNLFHSLREEASVILLFLKSVQSIKIHQRNQDGQIECVFKVEVAEDTREDVRRKRKEFLNKAKEPTITESRYIMNIQVTFGSQTENFRWLTVNQIGSTEERIAELADELCLLPWIGIAVPINIETNNTSSGRIFCFLPLPPDVDCHMGLPVHVHGYFGLTDNRRGLVWPGAECQNTATAEWNELLLKKIAVEVYCTILESLIQDEPCTGIGQEQRSQLIYSRLPALAKVQGHWSIVLEPLFQKLILESKKLFYAQRISRNSWVTLNEGILDRLQESGIASETREAILNILLNSSQVLITNVPHHVLEIVTSHFSPPRDITPSLLRSVLKSHNVNATSYNDKVLLLDFILRDDPTGDLNGIPLLPLANKQFATFCPHSHAEAPSTSVFVPTSNCTAMLLPNNNHRFLNGNLPEALRQKLIAMAANDVHSNNPTQLIPLTKEIVLQNLRSSLPSEWFSDPEKVQWIPGDSDHPPESWLKEIWNWIHSSFPDTLSPFENLPLVQLPPLPTTTDKCLGILSKHSRFIFALDGSGNILLPQVIGLLTAAGCTVLFDHPSYLHHPDINSYIAPPTTAGAMSVLSRASLQPAQEHIKLSTSNDRSSLREFFTRQPEYITTAHRHLLNQLPLFDTLHGSCTTVQVNGQILNAASPEFSLPSGFNFRKSDQIISSADPKAHQFLTILIVQILQPAEVFLRYLFPDIQAKSVYSLQETSTIMLWILQRIFNLKTQCKGFQDAMKVLPFVSTDEGHLKKPSELYDPNDSLLFNLFLGETNNFPSEEYNDEHVISTLKELGLRTRSMLTAAELLRVAESSPNSLSSVNKVQTLVEILEENPAYLDQLVDEEDTLKDKLLHLKWLPHAKAAPDSCRFPKSMPWFSSGTPFFAPTDLRSKSHVLLVGSTMPILDVRMNDNLQHELRLTSDPPVHQVVAQLKAAVQFWQQQDHKKATSQFQEMLVAIYLHLSQISKQCVSIAINYASLKQWIWNGTGFCSPAQVALENDFPLDLRPQLFLLPEDLNDGDSLTKFFLQHGVRPKFLQEDIISVLGAVKDKHASFVQDSNTLREIENDLKLCRSILEWFVEGGKTLSEYLQEKVLVPVQSTKNKLVLEPCRNCTYCDRDWLRHGGSELDVPGDYHLIHDSVPTNVAKSLGVPALSTCLLSAETLGFEFEQTGPFEPLTKRLSNILKEYKEGVDVFKELIQNADDAGASKVRFLVDWRQGPNESLLSPDMEHCQGPALWAYNDAVFTDKDFENINKLAGATKVEDLAKIGRFGLGFNAVYHLTDVPSFVSKEYFVVFDPNVHHLQSHITDRSRPGIRINLAKNPRPLTAFEDQFQPYHAIFKCDTQCREGGKFHYDGTLFRFPFRTLHQASKSEICQKVYDQEKVKKIVGSLRESVSLLLLYTQHVNKVELYQISKNSKPEMMQLVLSVKKSVSQDTYNEGSVHTSSFIRECSDWWRQKLASEDNIPARPSRSELITIDKREMVSDLFGNTGLTVKRETWLVSSCVGTESSVRLALGEGRKHGLLPCAGAATKLSNVPEEETMGDLKPIPEAIAGEAFCFLPLSIATGLPVHINGYFAITPNRRSIWERSTSELHRPIEVQWNESLMEDALSNAYIQLLEDIKRLLAGKSYYFQKLWPCYTTLESSTWGTLVKSVYSKLVKESLPLLWSNGKWLDIHSGYILDEDLKESPKTVEILNFLGENVFHLTPSICSTLKKSGHEDTLQSRIMTMDDFFKKFVFPNITNFPVKLRDPIVWFGLDRIFKGHVELIPLFQESAFVPTNEGQLKKVSEIYDPNDVLLQHLFVGERNKFPTKDFASEHALLTLKQLGLRTRSRATSVELLDVAETISLSLSSASSTRKIQALVNILQDNTVYLNQHINGNETLKDKLLQLKWLPRAETPPESCRFPESMPWFNNDAPFFAPTELRSKPQALLVGSTMPILDIGMSDPLQDELRLMSDPPIVQVIAHLKTAVEVWQQQDHKKATSKFKDMFIAIYHNLSQISKDKVADAINDASLKQWIWHGTGFCSPAQVALEKDFPLDLRPRLFLLPEDLNDSDSLITKFFLQQGVRQKFSEEDVISVLVAVKDKHASFVEDSNTSREIENDLKLCRSILEWFVEGGKILSESFHEKVLVPVQSTKNKLILEPCKNCTYCDRDWLRHGGSELDIPGDYQLIHDSIPTNVAKSLGVPALSTCLLSAETLGFEFEQTGPHEPLTTRLSNILKEYKEGVDVFKELIQNADDAGASKVRFLVDWRQGPKESLFSPDMEHCQGPALWAYNNATFTDKDFENINKLAGATKVEDLAKIGRFGLGFNAVYHLTDVPSFISREYFYVFDPNVHHLQSHIKDRSRPGIRINLANNPRPLSTFEDQFQPYHAIFNCDTQCREGGKFNYDGTLFRFPFRTLHQVRKSEICQKVYDKEKVKEVVASLTKSASLLLLYTQHINEVEVYELSKNDKPEMMQLVSSVKKSVPQDTYNEGSVYTSPFIKESSDWWRKKLKSAETVPAGPSRSELITINISEMVTGLLSNKDQSKRRETWLLSSCVGTDSSARLALGEGRKHGLLPCAGAATKLSNVSKNKTMDGAKLIPEAITGEAFCFLPLSIATGLPVHINGYFAITSNRRSIWERSTSEVHRPIEVQWNESLMEDALSNAYIHLLETMKHLHEVKSLERYYFNALWPCYSTLESNTWEPLVKSVYSMLVKESLPLLWSNEKWLDIHSGYILDKDLRETPGAVKTLNYLEVNVFDLTEEICSSLAKSGEEDTLKRRTLTLENFLTEFFFPNITKLPHELRDPIVCFCLDIILNGREAIASLIKENSCIQCSVDGVHLAKPDELINPEGAAADLFSAEDNRFPVGEDFLTSNRLHVLEELGMVKDQLSWDEICERAESIENLAMVSYERGLERARNLIKYLNKMIEKLPKEDGIENILRSTSFLPFMSKPPSRYGLPWKGSECEKSLSYAPKDLFLQKNMNLVGSCFLIVDDSDQSGCGKMEQKVKQLLGFYGHRPHHDQVLLQLDTTINTWSELSDKHKKLKKSRVESVCESIYTHFDDAVTKKNGSEAVAKQLKAQLDSKTWLFIQGTFVSSEKVAREWRGKGAPFLYGLPDAYSNKYQNLINVAEVKKYFDETDFVNAVNKLKDFKEGSPLTDDELSITVCFLSELKNSKKIFLDTNADRLFLPDNKKVLSKAEELSINNTPWLNDRGEGHYVHKDVTIDLAFKLGAKSLLERRRKKYSKRFGKPFGQHENLTDRLKNILKSYPCDSGILKELVQNADDAKATEIHFIYDTRTLPHKRVFQEHADEIQGPALCVYNNRHFNDEDLEGIQRLGIGSKRDDPEQTGQYGVGFNAVYHLTDCPSFLSNGDTLCLFDPHCRYAPDATPEAPGEQFTPVDAEFKEDFSDAFCGYLGQFFELKGSTMFRLPLRNRMQSQSLLSQTDASTKIHELLKSFKSEAKKSLLFLKHVKKISISKIDENGKLKREYDVTSIMDEDDERKRHTISSLTNKLKGVPTRDIPWEGIIFPMILSDSNNINEEWLVHQCFGVDKKTMNDANIPDGRSYGLLPRGGVAALVSSNRSSKSQYQTSHVAYCFLPLPVYTSLPVHVNGHFALDPARRALWRDTDSTKPLQKWNNFIKSHVLAPGYASLILEAKNYIPHCEREPEEKMPFFPSEGTAEFGLHWYHNLFPNLSDSKDEWNILAIEVYRFLGSTRAPVLPVVVAVDKNKNPEKESSRRIRSWLPAQEGFFLDRLKTKTREPLWKLLLQIRLPVLVSSPLTICNGFKEAEIIPSMVNPKSIINALRNFYCKNSKCEIGNLPSKIEDTNVRSTTNLKELIRYCQIEEDFASLLIGLPLLLTADGILRLFDENNKVYCSQFSDLFPRRAELFVHPDLVSDLLKVMSKKNKKEEKKEKGKADKKGKKEKKEETPHVLLHLTASSLDSFMPDVFPPSMRGVSKHQPFPEGVLFEEWLRRLWLFLQHFTRPGQDETFVSLDTLKEWPIIPTKCKQLVTIKNAKTVLDMSESGKQSGSEKKVLECLKKLHCPSLNTDITSKNARSPLNASTSISSNFSRYRSTATSQLSSKTTVSSSHHNTNEKKAVTDPYVAHPHNVADILQVLNYMRKTDNLDVKMLSHEEIYEILKFIQSDYKNLKPKKDFDDILKKLPLFKSINNSYYSLSLFSSYAIVPGGVLTQEIEKLQVHTRCLFLHSDALPTLVSLLEGLGARATRSVSNFYAAYILPNFAIFSYEIQLKYLTHIREYLLPSLYKEKEKEVFLNCLKCTACIPRTNGELHRASEFYDPRNSVFRIMVEKHSKQFPPCPFNETIWLDFLINIGLQSDVNENIFFQFCQNVASVGNHSQLDEINKVRSKELVRYLLTNHHLHESSFLTTISTVKFIASEKVKSNLLSFYKQYQCRDENQHPPFLQFSNSVPWEYRKLVWTSASLLPEWAMPTQKMLCKPSCNENFSAKLQIRGPSVETVISHLQNICGPLGEMSKKEEALLHPRVLNTVMTSIYEFFQGATACCGKVISENCNSECKTIGRRLKTTPCILVEDSKVLVRGDQLSFKVDPDKSLRPFLYEVPRYYGSYEHILKRLGATEEITSFQLAKLLKTIKDRCKEEAMNPEFESKAQNATYLLFKSILKESETSKGKSKISYPAKLYLPSEDKRLIKSNELLCKVPPRHIETVAKLHHSALLSLEKCGLLREREKEYLEALPAHLRPKPFHEVVIERLDPSCLRSTCKLCRENETCEFIEKHIMIMKSKEFQDGIVRLFKHQKTSNDLTKEEKEKSSRFGSSKVEIKCMETIQVHLILAETNQALVGSSANRPCYVVKEEDSWKLYIQHAYDGKSKLSMAINKVLDWHLDEKYLLVIADFLSCASTSQIADTLNSHDIERDVAEEELKIGREVPVVYHYLMQQNPLFVFHRGELVAFGVELREESEDVVAGAVENEDVKYVLVKVIRCVMSIQGGNTYDFEARYLIDLGNEKKEVSVLDLYKFYQNDPDENPITDMVPFTGDTSRKPTSLDEAKREISEALRAAWQLPLHMRRKVIKRLYLRWHPDKNPNNVEFATEMMVFLLSEIKRMEEEEQRLSEEPVNVDFDGMFRNCDNRASRERDTYRNYRNHCSGGSSRSFSTTSHYTNPNPREARRWLEQSEVDLKVAQFLLTARSPFNASACFFSHQIVEKSLKAALYAKCGLADEQLQTHDVHKLAQMVSNLAKWPPSNLIQLAVVVEHYYLPTRYPNRQPYPTVPANAFSREQSTRAVQSAKEVLEKVKAVTRI